LILANIPILNRKGTNDAIYSRGNCIIWVKLLLGTNCNVSNFNSRIYGDIAEPFSVGTSPVIRGILWIKEKIGTEHRLGTHVSILSPEALGPELV